MRSAENARNYTQCDSLLIGDKCGAHTFPYIDVLNSSAQMEHEATTSKIGEDQIFYCNQRGLSTEDAVSMIVNGFCKEVFNELPMEFAVEAKALLDELPTIKGHEFPISQFEPLLERVPSVSLRRKISLRPMGGYPHTRLLLKIIPFKRAIMVFK